MFASRLPRQVPSSPFHHPRHLATMSSSEIPHVMRRIENGDLPWGSVFTDAMLTMSWTKQNGWQTPQIKPYGPISFPPSTSVFHYGMEVFEGLKAYKSSASPHSPVRIFRPQLNIQRLNNSARRIALPTLDEHKFLGTLAQFVHQQSHWVPSTPGSSLYLRPTLIATDPRIGVRRSDSALLFVIASPVASFFSRTAGSQEKYQKGVSLLADPKYVRAWKGGVGQCKTGGNYANSIAPAEEACEKGFDQVLWLSDEERQLVTEVGMMNVFFVFRDPKTGRKRLVTPRLDGTILDGVTRRSILELAPELNIPVEERDISIHEVCDAVDDGRLVEMFGSGTAAVVCPVHKVTTPTRVVNLKQKEANGDLSVLFRERLLEIQSSKESHPWMVPVRGSPQTSSSYFDQYTDGDDEDQKQGLEMASTG